MTKAIYWLSLAVFGISACELAEPADAVTSPDQPSTQQPAAVGAAHPLEPGQSREIVLDGKRYIEEGRRTSSGELTRALVPAELTPTKEVPVGARCGVKDDQGALLSCQPGASCLTSSNGRTGSCIQDPPAPRWD